jgi:hypothetical protein
MNSSRQLSVTRAYYEQQFEIQYLRAKGIQFQHLFERLMGLAFKGDFLACAPWGNAGDRKNDGFLKSARTLFQVYAPEQITASRAIRKIKEDFCGAKQHWGTHFDKWVLVHNSERGLPPDVIEFLLNIDAENPDITVEQWSFANLRDLFRQISIEDLSPWLGAAPTEETKAALGFHTLQPVLESLANTTTPSDIPVLDVPAGKLESNALSDAVASLIRHGMAKTPLIEKFFSQWHDESLGERIAEEFRNHYVRLRETLPPSRIFEELQKWAGGSERGTPEHEMAVITVIAYYFERCDIYEAPRGTRL